MAALRSVVKHSYLTGKDQGVGRAQAHVRYIQFRGGKDKDEEPRSFFSGLRDDITGREVAVAVNDQNPRGTVMHKLILSPGVQGADVKEYCREVMADLGSRKGLDLEWYAVQHSNTDNPHVHIVVMGADANGHKVRLSKEDYTKVKEAGDRYLERNRLLDREEKERPKDKEDRNPVAKFVDALRAAALEFTREMEREAVGEKKPETKFQQRKRERGEERQQEISTLGEPIDLSAYLAKQANREEREESRKQLAWKEYCKPIEIDRGANEPIEYNRASSLDSLRQLEKDYKEDDPRVAASMDGDDATRLKDWIKEKFREEKRIESKAEGLEKIDVELDSETKGSWSKTSSLEELRKLEAMNARSEVYLDPAEQKALANWIQVEKLKEPIRIELEPGSEPVVYDREDSKESLSFLAKEYAKGADWATENLSKEEYQKVRTWIDEKDKSKTKEDSERPINLVMGSPEDGDGQSDSYYKTDALDKLKELEKDYRGGDGYVRSMGEKDYERLQTWIADREEDPNRAIKFGKTEDGKDKYLSKNLDKDVLQAAKEELEKSPEANKADLKLLDTWIAGERAGSKDANKTGQREDAEVTGDERIEHLGREFTKDTPLEELQKFRQELKSSRFEDWLEPEQFSQLCSWIGTKEKYGEDAFKRGDKAQEKQGSRQEWRGDKDASVPRRKRTAEEKLMNRDVRLDRSARWDNYYNEKSEQRQHLEGQRENLKAQKRSLDKYEKERETVDGQYSEIWGADKSAIAAGPMGAASGGLRPLGANQFVRLLNQVGKNEERKRDLAERAEEKTQARLEGELTKDAKTWKAPEEKQPEKEAEKPEKKDEKPKENKAAPVVREPVAEKEPPAIDNSALQTETKELSKDVKNKKAKEEDRDKRPATDPNKGEREDPFKYDPWGRY